MAMQVLDLSLPPPGAPPRWPLSVAAYHALGELGLIPKQTEMLHGFVYRKMPKSPLHCLLAQRLGDAVRAALPPGLILRVEQPVTCADSEPEPDLAVVPGPAELYRTEHPRTAQLVIEICVTSHDYDRAKLSAYAAAGVQECWLVLGPEQQIETHRQPGPEGFRQTVTHGPGGPPVTLGLAGLRVALDGLFAA